MSYKTASTFLQAKSAFFRDAMAKIVFVLGKKISAAIERRRIRTTLNKMDNYLLKDMGISRADIDRIAQSRRSPE